MSGSWRRGRSPPSAASLSDEDQGGARDSDRRGSDALLTRGAGMGLEVPPETRRAVAVTPWIRAQPSRWTRGGSGSPLEERQSMTREPESLEVTK